MGIWLGPDYTTEWRLVRCVLGGLVSVVCLVHAQKALYGISGSLVWQGASDTITNTTRVIKKPSACEHPTTQKRKRNHTRNHTQTQAQPKNKHKKRENAGGVEGAEERLRRANIALCLYERIGGA